MIVVLGALADWGLRRLFCVPKAAWVIIQWHSAWLVSAMLIGAIGAALFRLIYAADVTLFRQLRHSLVRRVILSRRRASLLFGLI